MRRAAVLIRYNREHLNMLPDFDENGNLPPGIHRASPSEIEERFGRDSEVR